MLSDPLASRRLKINVPGAIVVSIAKAFKGTLFTTVYMNHFFQDIELALFPRGFAQRGDKRLQKIRKIEWGKIFIETRSGRMRKKFSLRPLSPAYLTFNKY